MKTTYSSGRVAQSPEKPKKTRPEAHEWGKIPLLIMNLMGKEGIMRISHPNDLSKFNKNNFFYFFILQNMKPHSN